MIDRSALVPSYAEAVYEALREEILSGTRRPGEHLVELEIATRMGISQGPVREALARLREQGLIISLAHRGSFVSEITVEEARDVYDTRLVLERYAVSLALPRLGDEQFARLEREITAMTTAAEGGDFMENVAHDMTFHRLLFEWSESSTLLAFWHVIEAKTRKFVAVVSPPVFRDPVRPARSHYALLNKMKAGAWPALEAELERHLSAIWIEMEH